MNVRLLHLFAVALLLSGRLWANEDTVPVQLRPYIELAKRCERLAVDLFEDFESDKDVGWRVATIDENTPQPVLTLELVDGRSVLVIAAGERASAGVIVGPPLSGDNRVEMVAYSDTDKPCDLSLFLGEISAAPGFQFGGHNNTRNSLWTDLGQWDGRWHAEEIRATPLITPRHWHTVSLERIGYELVGAVDGQELGRVRLSNRVDIKAPYEPMIYCYGTRILVDRFTVKHIGEDDEAGTAAAADVPDADRWQKVFGDVTRADADRQVAELIVLLDHQSSRVRDGAQRLLTRMLPIARGALERTVKDGTFEQQLRGRDILGAHR